MRCDGHLTDSNSFQSGVRQGGVVSPLLLCLVSTVVLVICTSTRASGVNSNDPGL